MTKIAFIGAHGTGKTTLAHELFLNLGRIGINVKLLEEIARKCPFPINENAPKETQLWNITKQISEELEKEKNCEVLICDRSILDSYIYQIKLYNEEKNWEPFIKEYLKTYNLLIKVPIRKGYLKDDGIRSTNPIFQKEIDKLLNKKLRELKINYIKFQENKTIKEICSKYNHKSL